MALVYSRTTNAIAHNLIVPRVADNLYDSHAMYSRLVKQEAVDYGYALKYQYPIIQKKNSSSGWFTGTGKLNTDYVVDQATAAEFSMKTYYVNVTLPLTVQIQFDGDPASAVRGSRLEADNARMTLEDDMGIMAWNDGTDTTQPEGLKALFTSGGTYGNLSPTDFSGWAAQLDATTSSVATLTPFINLFYDCWKGNDAPNMGITNKFVYRALANLIPQYQRWTDDSYKKANQGFPVIEILGRPIYLDPNCPGTSGTANNYFAWLNTRWFWLGLHKMLQKDGVLMEDVGAAELSAARLYRLYWIGAIICNNRRMQGACTVLKAT